MQFYANLMVSDNKLAYVNQSAKKKWTEVKCVSEHESQKSVHLHCFRWKLLYLLTCADLLTAALSYLFVFTCKNNRVAESVGSARFIM